MIEKTIHQHAGGFSRIRIPCLLAGLFALHGAHMAVAAAGLAITHTDRLSGEVVVLNESVTVGGTPVGWDEAVLVINSKTAELKIAGNALEFKNGEVWTGLIESMKDGMVEFTSPVLGRRTVAVEKLRSLNFQPSLPPATQQESNVLYRRRGNPSPGALLSVDAKRISAETSLGVLSFERDRIERYVFEAGFAAPSGDTGTFDAVALADGNIFHGTTRARNGALVIEHAVAGEISLASNAWSWFCHYSPDLIHLAETKPKSTRTMPLILHPPDPPWVEQGHSPTTDDSRSFVRRIHILPRTIIAYKTGKGEFSSTLSLDRGARGPALVRFRAGEKILKEYILKPTDKIPVPVKLPVEMASGLVVEVDFGKAILFPCGVVLDDPLVLLKP